MTINISSDIFRAYDIRGIVDEQLTEEAAYYIGRAFGSKAQQTTVIVARDGRESGKRLSVALMRGLNESGCDVIDIGRVPTALLYFATNILSSDSGIMITGSHNPSNYNGLKMVLKSKTLSGDAVAELYKIIKDEDFAEGEGTISYDDVVDRYIERVVSDIKIEKPLKVVLDCGNGIAGVCAERLFKELGCETVMMFDDVDGNFPNHHPDPSVAENLQDIIKKVQEENADVGLAFDGDADRLGVVTNRGEIIWPDRQMILYARDVLSRHPKSSIVYDVKCTRWLGDAIEKADGKPLMWKTGHSVLKQKMIDMNAPLAGELSGHIFFKERWYGFDDGLYVGARFLEIISRDDKSVSEIFKEIPDSISTPELKVMLDESEKFDVVDKIVNSVDFPEAKINKIDGVRVDWDDGWALVRASNTTPCLTVRFEADTDEVMQRIQSDIKNLLQQVKADWELPF